MTKISKSFREKQEKTIDLDTCDPAFHGDWTKEAAETKLNSLRKEMGELQSRLYANKKRALLVVLQGIDASGKDGTIKTVMTGINPLGCQVTAFKVPEGAEKAHDFLWRVHQVVPQRGFIGIFNRSHYEDILVPSVHRLLDKETVENRYEHINGFEKMLSEEGTVILKFFLHISKSEQSRRLNDRLTDPQKNWKYSDKDLEERKHWGAYQKVYQQILHRCSTPWAPWLVVPSDHKWYRNVVVADTIVRTLKALKEKYPVQQLE